MGKEYVSVIQLVMRIGIVKKAFVQQIFFLIDFERPLALTSGKQRL